MPALRRSRGPVVAVLAVWTSLATAVALPSEAKPGDQPRVRDQNRDRWEKLTPEARQRLREAYRKLEALPSNELRILLDRLRAMNPQERREAIDAARKRVRRAAKAGVGLSARPPRGEAAPRVSLKEARRPRAPSGNGAAPAGRPSLGPLVQDLPPEARRRIESLPPEERAREARRMVDRMLRSWREKLPTPLGERIGRFTKKEQIEFFRASRESDILGRTFPLAGEVDALLGLPPEVLRAIARPDAQKPPEISDESWARWQAVPPPMRQRLLRRIDRLRQERSEEPQKDAPEGQR